jgi:hypothetical protein
MQIKGIAEEGWRRGVEWGVTALLADDPRMPRTGKLARIS